MKPNFIIIGPARTGTTSIYHYLRQHPHIYMSPIKETKYFACLAAQIHGLPAHPVDKWPVTDWPGYLALFEGAEKFTAVGEASPMYFYMPHVPEQIRTYLPDVKLVTILRNPVDRAYSHYLKNVRDGLEARSFTQAVEEELAGKFNVIQGRYYYLRIGYFHQHLMRFLNVFEKDRLGIFLFDDMQVSPSDFMRTMFEFLEVDPDFLPDMSAHFNRGGVPHTGQYARIERSTKRWKNRIPRPVYLLIHRLYNRLQESNLEIPPLPAELRGRLRDLYAEDVTKLQSLIGRDLSGWLRA